VAVEVQGEQHFEPVWGEENLRRVQRNDEIKRKRCKANGMSLIRVKRRESMDINDDEIRTVVEQAAASPGTIIDLY